MADLWLELEPEADTAPSAYNQLLRELKQSLSRDLCVTVTLRAAGCTVPDRRDAGPRGDHIALATMLLAIPAAALALHDLAARTKLKDCLHRVRARARQAGTRARWRYSVEHIALPGDVPDDALEPDELIDRLARAQVSTRRE